MENNNVVTDSVKKLYKSVSEGLGTMMVHIRMSDREEHLVNTIQIKKVVLIRRSYEISPKDDYIDLSEYMNIPPDTSDEVLKEDFFNL